MKVKNMESFRRGGREVPNQFIIYGDDGSTTFQSYMTTIARKSRDGVTIDESKWDCSRTILKYLCRFLGMDSKKTIEQALKKGLIKFEDLNKEL